MEQSGSLIRGFECLACGSCCSQPGYVHLTPEDIKTMAAGRGMDPQEFRKTYTESLLLFMRVLRSNGNSCLFLENGKCSVYEFRPKQCRTFPFWKHLMNDAAEISRVKGYCKGIK